MTGWKKKSRARTRLIRSLALNHTRFIVPRCLEQDYSLSTRLILQDQSKTRHLVILLAQLCRKLRLCVLFWSVGTCLGLHRGTLNSARLGGNAWGEYTRCNQGSMWLSKWYATYHPNASCETNHLCLTAWGTNHAVLGGVTSWVSHILMWVTNLCVDCEPTVCCGPLFWQLMGTCGQGGMV
jgi:hypothetical protein